MKSFMQIALMGMLFLALMDSANAQDKWVGKTVKCCPTPYFSFTNDMTLHYGLHWLARMLTQVAWVIFLHIAATKLRYWNPATTQFLPAINFTRQKF